MAIFPPIITSQKTPSDRILEQLGTPVFSEVDIRRVTRQRLHDGRPCSLVLAQTMKVTSILFPGTLNGLTISSAPGVVIISDGPDAAFRVATPRAILRDLRLRSRFAGAVGIEVADGADFVRMENLSFEVRANLAGEGFFAKAISVTGAVTAGLKVLECAFQSQRGIVVESGASLANSTIRGCQRRTASLAFTPTNPFCAVGGIPDYLDNDAMSVDVSASSTANGGRVIGNHDCDITIGANCGHVAIVGNDGSFDVTTTAGTGNNRLAGNKQVSGAKALSATDHDADGGVLVPTALTGANPTVTIGSATYARLTFGAGASGNVSLSDGQFSGQPLTLFCVSYAGTASLPDSTASNVKLSAVWTPTADDTLSLIWDATDGNWIEVGRSAN